MDSPTDCSSPVEQQPESETNPSNKPSLAQFKKSWGFRRSTIAKREFMEEVGDVNTSPPLVRKSRGRRSKTSSLQTTPSAQDKQKASCSSKIDLDELEWSAPSSPASEEGKTPSEPSTGASMDPSMWQSFGSAFHTAFSLLGGTDGSLLDMGQAVATQNLIGVSDDEPEAPLPEPLEEREFPSQAVDILEDLKMSIEPKVDYDCVSISSKEESSNEMTELDITQTHEIQEQTKVTKSGRGKARGKGRGRGRGRGKGRGRGRGKTAQIKSNNNYELAFSDLPELPVHEVEDDELGLNPQVPAEMAQMCFNLSISPPHQSDCMVEQDQSIAGQFDDAAGVGREESVGDLLYVPDPDVVCRICEQTQNNRSMICCTSCQGWFHGDCVGDMKTEGKEYVCLVCIEPNLLQADLSIPPDLGMSPLKSLIQSPPAEDNEELENQQTQSSLEMMEVEESPLLPVFKTEPAPTPVSQATSPVCIGPDCCKPALQGSVYCGSDCIMQHAAATIKNLSVPKSPKTRTRAQRKAASPQAPAKSQRASRASKRLANREVPEESMEEEEQPESHSSQTCNPSVTEAQATQCNASTVEDLGVTTEASEAVTQASAETMTEIAETTSVIPAPVSVPPLKDSTPSLRNLPPLKDCTPSLRNLPPLKDCTPSLRNIPPLRDSTSTVKTIPPLKDSTSTAKTIPPLKDSTSTAKTIPPLKDSTSTVKTIPPLKDSTSTVKTIPPLKDSTSTVKTIPPLKDSTSTVKTIPPLKDSTPTPKNVPQPKENSLKSKPAPEPTQLPPEKAKDSSSNKNISKLSSAKVNSPKTSAATTTTKAVHSQAATKQTKPAETPSPALPVSRMHQTGAIVVKKTAYVIPKKAPPPQPPANQVPAPPSQGPAKKPSPAPAVQTETRNLPVPPAPSAPSSRPPSQPNNQVRQSIQRSLVGILFKRVCDSEELDMSENDVGKLVTNIETEMFNIFRNTDSKYMNKYRTIMFNLKDPKNKGLLYRLVQGEISPFRLVRMSQKDMQAIQLPEPTVKEVKATPCGAGSPQKPEPVKLDLPSLIQTRSDRTKNVPQQALKKTEPIVKSKTTTQSSKAIGTAADILTCMLKDTTSDHHKHLFDVKCKICTGQMPQEDVAEPVQKKLKLSEDKREPLWKRSKEDSPLRAPPDSPDIDSSMSHMGSPVLTIVESPVSPTTQDSPASPILDTPASPVMESPASPTSDDRHLAPRKSYAPVVIPAVSTVTITRRDPRTAASRYTALTNSSAALSEKETQKTDSYFPSKGNSSAPPVSFPTAPVLPKSILTKPSHSGDPRLYGFSSRNSSPKVLPQGGTLQFLAKQDILWKGFLNMLTIAKFVTKGYLVSGSSEHLKADLPDTIQIGGRILPKTVWDYVAKLKTSVTKDVCVIRFQPATDEEEVAYVSLFSYFSSRGRFGVVANSSHSIKDMYLFPLSAKEAVPSVLQPLEGPGFEKDRPNLLLGLAVVQKTKRPGCQAPEVEEKRHKVTLSSDPSWIPKPPSLYGSNKVEDFEQPYDPEIPISITPPSSPPRPTFSSASSVTTAPAESVFLSKSNKEGVATKTETPLQTILQLFPSEASSKTKVVSSKKCAVSMVDPIVQQFGGKTAVKEIEEEDNDDLDRPYDPEEEYDPAGYSVVPKNNVTVKEKILQIFEDVDDDVAYDPEDESIFEDIESNSKNISGRPEVSKPNSSVQDSPQVTPAPECKPSAIQTTASPAAAYAVPTGTVVVSAETLTVQQRMLEDLNRQIEEQKRQLKEQEEALRKQREAVGMFMAQFSVSDSLTSPSSALPISTPVTLQSGITEENNNTAEDDASEKDNSETDNLNDISEPLEAPKEIEITPSPGEVVDSDVAYDPEDESLFDEIQAGMLENPRLKLRDSSVSKTEKSSSHSKKRKYSPKRRSHRERGHHQSPPRRSQRRSPSRSRRRRERDRHQRSERTGERHRSRDRSERHSRTQRDSTSQTRSRRRRRSSSTQRNKHSVSLSPRRRRDPSPFRQADVSNEANDLVSQNCDENLPFHSPDDTNNVTAEEMELLLNQEHLANSDNILGDLKQLKWAADLMMDGKLDSLIPLRELQPPITDSPQSPDPEPKFSEQSITESMDTTEANAEPETIGEKIKIENNPQPIPTPKDYSIEQKQLGLIEGAAVALVKVEFKSEDTEKLLTKKLDDPIPSVVELPPTKNEPLEDSPCKVFIPGLGDLDHVLKTSRDGSPALKKEKEETIVSEEISIKSNKDHAIWGRKGMHDKHLNRRHQMSDVYVNADRGIRNDRESANDLIRDQHSMLNSGRRPTPDRESNSIQLNPKLFNTGPGNSHFSESHIDMRGGGELMGSNFRDVKGLEERSSGSFMESTVPNSGFATTNLSGQRPEIVIDAFQHKLRGKDLDASWNKRGSPHEGPGSHRGRHGGSPFSRGAEPRDIPVDKQQGGSAICFDFEHTDASMNYQGSQRGGFGRGEDHQAGSMENSEHISGFIERPGEPDFDRGGSMAAPGPLRGGFRGAGFQRGGSVCGPGPQRGGFGGLGFGRGSNLMDGSGNHREGLGLDRSIPLDRPGHHRGGFQGQGFGELGSLDGTGMQRGGCGGPGFRRGGSQDVLGPKRGGLEKSEFDIGPMDGPGPNRGGFRGPGFGKGGPLVETGPQSGEYDKPEFDRGPIDRPGHHRGDFAGPSFGRGEHRGPMHGSGLRGGFEQQGFGRGSPMSGPGPQREGHEEQDPFDGLGPPRRGFGRPRYGRGGEHHGHIDGSGPHRGFAHPRSGIEGEHVNSGPHRGGHGEPNFERGTLDGTGHQRDGFGETGLNRDGPMDGPGPHRGAHADPGFNSGSPIDGSRPYRGGCRVQGLGRGGENCGPIDRIGHHREEWREPDYVGVGTMDGPGPHRGGFGRAAPMGGPGPQRGGLGEQGFRRCGPVDEPGHQRGGFGRCGPVDEPGHQRGGFGGPGFGRASPMGGPGTKRGPFEGQVLDRGDDHMGGIESSEHIIEGHGEPNCDGEHPMDGSQQHKDGLERSGFIGSGPMDDPRCQRGGHSDQRFGRGGKHVHAHVDDQRGFPGPDNSDGPMDGPVSNRGGYRGERFGRRGEHTVGPRDSPGLNRGFGRPGYDRGCEIRDCPMGDGEGSEDPGFGRDGPVEGPGPNRGGHRGRGFAEHHGGPIEGPGNRRLRPHKGGFRGSGFGRSGEHCGIMDDSGHPREGCGEPDYERGGPVDGLGPQRGGFGGPGSMDRPWSRRGGHRGAGQGRGGEHRRGPEEPAFGDSENREDPVCGPRSHRGYRGPDFERGGERRMGSMDEPTGRDYRGHESNPASQRGRPRPEIGPEGEGYGPGMENRGCIRGNPNPSFRGHNRPFGGSRGGPGDRRYRGDFSGPPTDDQRPGWRPDCDRSMDRSRQHNDRLERPRPRRESRSNDRERGSGQDLRSDHRGPPRCRSPIRERSAPRKNQESSLESTISKLDSKVAESNKKETEIKNPKSSAIGFEQSNDSRVDPNSKTEDIQPSIPPRQKAPLLPTPTEGPMFPFHSQGRPRGRGRIMR